MKVLFFGSSNYCLTLVETLFSTSKLVGIITHPDKKIGRDQFLSSSDTKKFAQQHSIPVLTPGSYEELKCLKKDIASLVPDIAVVADYGRIIPPEIYTIPTFKTINVHFSKLPKYRGASPVQYTILNGERSAWITIQLLAKKLDTGDILWQKEEPLKGDETTGTLYPKLFEIASTEIIDVINKFTKGKLIPIKQNEKDATYTRRLTRNDGFIPFSLFLRLIKRAGKKKDREDNQWIQSSVLKDTLSRSRESSRTVERALRAFTPWPGIWTEIQVQSAIRQPADKGQSEKRKLKILQVHLEANKLVPDIVQLEGKNLVSWKQFLEGYPIALP